MASPSKRELSQVYENIAYGRPEGQLICHLRAPFGLACQS